MLEDEVWVAEVGTMKAEITRRPESEYFDVKFNFTPSAGRSGIWHPTLTGAKRLAGAELRFQCAIRNQPKPSYRWRLEKQKTEGQ